MRPNEVGKLTYNPPNEAKTAIAKILRFWTRPAYTCISWAHRVRSISTHPDAPARALRRAVVRFVPTASPAIVGKLREKFGFWQSSYTRTSPGRPGRVFLVCENCEKLRKISHCGKQNSLQRETDYINRFDKKALCILWGYCWNNSRQTSLLLEHILSLTLGCVNGCISYLLEHVLNTTISLGYNI